MGSRALVTIALTLATACGGATYSAGSSRPDEPAPATAPRARTLRAVQSAPCRDVRSPGHPPPPLVRIDDAECLCHVRPWRAGTPPPSDDVLSEGRFVCRPDAGADLSGEDVLRCPLAEPTAGRSCSPMQSSRCAYLRPSDQPASGADVVDWRCERDLATNAWRWAVERPLPPDARLP